MPPVSLEAVARNHPAGAATTASSVLSEILVVGLHEQAYLLAKGDPAPPARPLADVIPFDYTGNALHPTQKPVAALRPLIGVSLPKTPSALE